MKRKVIASACIGVAGVLLFVLLRSAPIGAVCIPYFVASIDEGHQVSGMPWRIIYNDAGAAHSGNFWTWVIEDRGLYRIVIAQGYSTADVRYGAAPLPAKKESGSICLGFTTTRYGTEIQWQRVDAHARASDFVAPKDHQDATGIPQCSDAPLNWFDESTKEEQKAEQGVDGKPPEAPQPPR